MKIQFDTSGKNPAKPDFAMLRAGLAAVQAATPTATANGKAQTRLDLTEALTRLFGDQNADRSEFRTLHGSFNPTSVPDDADAEPKR